MIATCFTGKAASLNTQEFLCSFDEKREQHRYLFVQECSKNAKRFEPKIEKLKEYPQLVL